MYREGLLIIHKVGAGGHCAVTVHSEGDDFYYVCRECSNDLDYLKRQWAHYNARFISIDELISLELLPSFL